MMIMMMGKELLEEEELDLRKEVVEEVEGEDGPTTGYRVDIQDQDKT